MITDLPPCPVETALLLISDKWAVLILRDLRTGTKRFNELMRSVTGVSQKALTEKLRRMEENELIARTVYPEVPPRVGYSLTPLGESLAPILDAMEDWGWWYKRLVAESSGEGLQHAPDVGVDADPAVPKERVDVRRSDAHGGVSALGVLVCHALERELDDPGGVVADAEIQMQRSAIMAFSANRA